MVRETGKEKGKMIENEQRQPVDRKNIHTGPLCMTQPYNLYYLSQDFCTLPQFDFGVSNTTTTHLCADLQGQEWGRSAGD